MRGVQLFLFWFVVVLLAVGFLWLFQGILAPFILGMAIAYLLNPPVKKLEGLGWPRWLAVLSLLFVFLSAVAVAVAFLVPLLLHEGAQLVHALPVVLLRFQEAVIPLAQRLGIDVTPDAAVIVDQIQGQAGTIFKAGRNVLTGVIAGGAVVVSFVSFVFLMPIVAFYMMVDWPHVVAKFGDLVPRSKADVVGGLMGEADRTLAGFIRGQLSVCAILGLFYGVGLSIAGVPFGFVIGLVAGILSIMPYVGSGLGLIAALAFAWFGTGDSVTVLAALAVFGIGQFFEGNFLTPRLVGENVGLHPLWVIFALMAGGSLFGFAGLLVAVPVAAVIGVLVRFAIAEYKKSGYYTAG